MIASTCFRAHMWIGSQYIMLKGERFSLRYDMIRWEILFCFLKSYCCTSCCVCRIMVFDQHQPVVVERMSFLKECKLWMMWLLFYQRYTGFLRWNFLPDRGLLLRDSFTRTARPGQALASFQKHNTHDSDRFPDEFLCSQSSSGLFAGKGFDEADDIMVSIIAWHLYEIFSLKPGITDAREAWCRNCINGWPRSAVHLESRMWTFRGPKMMNKTASSSSTPQPTHRSKPGLISPTNFTAGNGSGWKATEGKRSKLEEVSPKTVVATRYDYMIPGTVLAVSYYWGVSSPAPLP